MLNETVHEMQEGSEYESMTFLWFAVSVPQELMQFLGGKMFRTKLLSPSSSLNTCKTSIQTRVLTLQS